MRHPSASIPAPFRAGKEGNVTSLPHCPPHRSAVLGIGALAVTAALVVAAIAAAKPDASSKTAAPAVVNAKAHSCLVMVGSGDPAFTKNFNPYTATGLPSGQFVRGAIYEGLTISPEGGKPTLPGSHARGSGRTATRR